MKIDLAGQTAVLAGARNAVSDGVAAALRQNGASLLPAEDILLGPTPDLLVLSHPLDLSADLSPALTETARQAATAMAARGAGRIVHILSAIGLVPMRRHEAASAVMAAAIASLRVLAMQAAPKVLVNGVAAGFIDTENGAADPAMLSHVPLARGGAAEEVVNAVLFLCDPMNSYTVGQVLAVDGGWAAGYGRDF